MRMKQRLSSQMRVKTLITDNTIDCEMVHEDEGDKSVLCFVVHHLYYLVVLQTEASVLFKDQRTEDRGEGITVNDEAPAWLPQSKR